jgi:hypothetical protein
VAFTFLIDWDKDGEFTDLYDDVTARARTRLAPVQCEYGRDQSTALAPTTAGRGGFTLDNRSRDYSPRNSLSPLYGKSNRLARSTSVGPLVPTRTRSFVATLTTAPSILILKTRR